MLLTVRGELPLLLIVSVRVAKVPTWTLPKVKLPLSPITDVAAVSDTRSTMLPLLEANAPLELA